MRRLILAAVSIVLAAFSPAAHAEDAPEGVKGIFLMADFPSVTIRPGATSTVSLKLQNWGLPPEMLDLSVQGEPSGWHVSLLGGGQPVAAAMPPTNGNVSLQLRIEVPANATAKETLTVKAKGKDADVSLPIVVSFAKNLPAKLSVEPRLPNLRGTAKSSFEFTIAVKNDSGKNLLVSLAAQAPQNFETSFTEAYGSQELSSIPIDAGQSKDVKLKVRPPSTVKAGQYPVTMRAAAEDANVDTKVALDITGQPQLSVAGRRRRRHVERDRGRRQGILDSDRDHQHRHGTGRRRRTLGQRSERVESGVRAQIARQPRARSEPRSTGAHHAVGKGGCGRLRHEPARDRARRERVGNLPHRRDHVDALGRHRHRHHCGFVAGAGRRGGKVRPAMSDVVIDAQGLTKRYDGAPAVD